MLLSSAKNCTTAKYTIDGSDPKAFGTEFTSSKVITIGDTCEIGDSSQISQDRRRAEYALQGWGATPRHE